MYIKKVKEMPTEGQFTAIWIFEGKVYSSNYNYVKGMLIDMEEGWVTSEARKWLEEDDKEYFIAQEYKNANK
tara:strand:- start:1113 stop:1328 length:216 start_codon:yes stop_codon:yes gene_type:complete